MHPVSNNAFTKYAHSVSMVVTTTGTSSCFEPFFLTTTPSLTNPNGRAPNITEVSYIMLLMSTSDIIMLVSELVLTPDLSENPRFDYNNSYLIPSLSCYLYLLSFSPLFSLLLPLLF
jgi:hypothetical protein